MNLKVYKDSSNPYARRIKLSRDGDFMPWIWKIINEYETRNYSL